MYLNNIKAAGENSASLRLPFSFSCLNFVFHSFCDWALNIFKTLSQIPNPYSAALIPSATETLARREVL